MSTSDAVPTSTPTPREVVELLRTGRSDEIRFASDAVYETPSGLPGSPRRYDGPEVIAEHFAVRRADPLTTAMQSLEVHTSESVVYETTDPEVVVFELSLAGRRREGSDPFAFTSTIGVLRVRDGEIVHWRDYPNMIGAAEEAHAESVLADMLLTHG